MSKDQKFIALALTLLSIASVGTALADQPTSESLVNPVHPGSELPFSYSGDHSSSEDGVCRALGYEQAVKGSALPGNSKAETIQVREDGLVHGAPYDWTLSKVTCMNKLSAPLEKTMVLVNPRFYHNGEFFPIYGASHEEGICTRIIGFNRAAKGGLRYGDKAPRSYYINYFGKAEPVYGEAIAVGRVVCVLDRY